jgi:ribosomal VAR1-like protein
MLNILKKKQNIYDNKSLNIYINKERDNKILDKLNKSEYENIIYYPSSSKEWFSSIYTYSKSYIKSLISIDLLLNNLVKSYFNMLEDKIKLSFKRIRPNKIRYSANKIYVSRAELKHTNTKLTIILYTYNKQKSSIEHYIRKIIIVEFIKELLGEEGLEKITTYKNRLLYILRKRFFFLKKWNNGFLKKDGNILKNIPLNLKRRYIKLCNIPLDKNALSKKSSRLEQIFFNSAQIINFNVSKFNDLFLNFRKLGLISIIEKIYNKNVEIKLVELKSIHLNSDVFSSAVALKLRDRKNKAVTILRKAILQMVKIPDLHTLITFDDNSKSMDKNNILNVIKQQVVSGVRFEASGRLTRRLTAMRAVFKYRYTGSLKNIRSSLNNKSSTMLRGYVKSNSQYTIINSKTRNGSFGLKGWVSSH